MSLGRLSESDHGVLGVDFLVFAVLAYVEVRANHAPVPAASKGLGSAAIALNLHVDSHYVLVDQSLVDEGRYVEGSFGFDRNWSGFSVLNFLFQDLFIHFIFIRSSDVELHFLVL